MHKNSFWNKKSNNFLGRGHPLPRSPTAPRSSRLQRSSSTWHPPKKSQLQPCELSYRNMRHVDARCCASTCSAEIVAANDYFGNHHVHSSCTSHSYSPSWSLFFTTLLTQKHLRLLHLRLHSRSFLNSMSQQKIACYCATASSSSLSDFLTGLLISQYKYRYR